MGSTDGSVVAPSNASRSLVDFLVQDILLPVKVTTVTVDPSSSPETTTEEVDFPTACRAAVVHLLVSLLSVSEPASSQKQHVDSLIKVIDSTATTAKAVVSKALTEGSIQSAEVDLKTSLGGRAARALLEEIVPPDVALMTAVLTVIRNNMHMLLINAPTTIPLPHPLPSSTIDIQDNTHPFHSHHCSLSMAARVRGLSVLAQALELMLDQSVWRGNTPFHLLLTLPPFKPQSHIRFTLYFSHKILHNSVSHNLTCHYITSHYTTLSNARLESCPFPAPTQVSMVALSIGGQLPSTSSSSSSSSDVAAASSFGSDAGPSLAQTLTSACLLVSKLLNHQPVSENETIIPASGSSLAQPQQSPSQQQHTEMAYGPPSEANRCLKALWKPLRTLSVALKTAEEKRKSQLALVDEHGVSIDEGITSGRGWSHGGLPHPRRVGNDDSDDDESGACEGKRGGGVTPGSSL